MNPNLKLMPFQQEGVYLLTLSKRKLLAWSAGVGKTPVGCRALTMVKAKRVLIFCPAIAVSVWQQHLRDWTDYKNVRAFKGAWVNTPYSFLEDPDSVVCVVPYSRVTKTATIVKACAKFSDQWDAVIIDEVHALKNTGAQRTQCIFGQFFDLVGSPIEHAQRIWAFSGTPVLNHAHELWPMLHALAPETLRVSGGPMHYEHFVERYCVTKTETYGIRVTGSRNTFELAGRVKPFMSRKRIRDVLPDLPDLRITERYLPEDTPLPLSLRDALEELVESGYDFTTMSDEDLLAAVQADMTSFSAVRRLIGGAKVEPTAAIIEDMLEDDPDHKVIVFCHHRDSIAALAETLAARNPLVIHGGITQTQREKIIAEFQHAQTSNVIILSIDAASEAITLTAANRILIMEPSPVPSRNAQAIARAHRMGQKNAVLAQFIILPGTLDERLLTLIARKTKAIAEIVDSDLTKPKQLALFPEERI